MTADTTNGGAAKRRRHPASLYLISPLDVGGDFADRLRAAWGDARAEHDLRWPLVVKASRVRETDRDVGRVDHRDRDRDMHPGIDARA